MSAKIVRSRVGFEAEQLASKYDRQFPERIDSLFPGPIDQGRKWFEGVWMPTRKTKMGRDLERIKSRLRAGRKNLRASEIKAEKLEGSIQVAIQDQENRKKQWKP